jgi:hypothetical protein
MNGLTQSKNTTILPVLIALMLACFALSPQVRAVCQEGCLIRSNTVLGDDALLNNTVGFNNTAIGFESLNSNTTGFQNTANGDQALKANTTGSFNMANGFNALYLNTTGSFNTANGAEALEFTDAGSFNTATGYQALWSCKGNNNTGTGALVLYANTIGNNNTANGVSALFFNTTGHNNTAIGQNALLHNVTGRNNIAVGANAGFNLTTGRNNIDIGNAGVTDESTTIRIGDGAVQTATYIAGISGATVPTGVAVMVDADGHLGTTTSSARYKEGIKPMDKASEAILALHPVTFRYKQELDPDGVPQFGLVAEEVEKVNSDLVAHDEEGKPYTVRYEAVNAMLLNEFLKEHKAFREEQRTVEELKKQVAALTAGLQKVSAHLEASKPAPQVVNNP